MDRLILKQDIVDRIKEDQLLYGKVAYVLGIGAPSLRAVLRANHEKLTQAAVLRVLRDHLGKKKDSDLLTNMQPEKISA